MRTRNYWYIINKNFKKNVKNPNKSHHRRFWRFKSKMMEIIKETNVALKKEENDDEDLVSRSNKL